MNHFHKQHINDWWHLYFGPSSSSSSSLAAPGLGFGRYAGFFGFASPSLLGVASSLREGVCDEPLPGLGVASSLRKSAFVNGVSDILET